MNGQNPFALNYGGQQQQSPFAGLAGLIGQYEAMRDAQQPDPNSFASQTPGAPSQPGRVDQTSFSPRQQAQGEGGMGGMGGMMGALPAMAMTNPFWLLSANIAKRFGG